MGKRMDRAFSKTIALTMALLLASASLTGCDLGSRPQETPNEIELEAPEPDQQELEELEGEEISAEVDPKVEQGDKEEEGKVVEEPEKSQTGSEQKGDANQSVADRFIDTSDVFGSKNNSNSGKIETVTTSALIPESVVKPEKMNTVVYQPVGAAPSAKEETKVLAQPTAGAPKPERNRSYSSARFSQKGTYSEPKVYKNGYIDVGSVTLSNKTFTGDLYIDVDSGSISLKNVTVLGKIYITDGSDWVKLYDVNTAGLVIENNDTSRVFASRATEVSSVVVKSDAVLEEGGLYSNSRGFANVSVNAPKRVTLTLKNLGLNELKTLTACDVVYDNDNIINHVYANAPTELYGYGQINRLYCNSNGVYYDARPLYIETGKGYATPSKRNPNNVPDDDDKEKKVTLYDINDQYLNIGEKKIVGIDHNGTSLKVTTSNSSVAKVTYSTSKSHITMTGVKPGKATIKVTSSRAGYESSTISFQIVVKENSSGKINLSAISNQYMDEDTTRYVTVHTDASRISVSNSDSDVASVTADGFQLKIRAKDEGTTTVKVTASRNGYPSKSTTFKIVVRDWDDDDDDDDDDDHNHGHNDRYVSMRRIDNQILDNGSQRIINVSTNASSLKASSSNSNVAKVSVNRDDTLRIEAVGTGSAWITVTGSRRGYRDAVREFRVDVYGDSYSAPKVTVRYNGIYYPDGHWTNQDVTFNLDGYNSSRTPYYNERSEGSSGWSSDIRLSDGKLTVKEEGRKEYRFFTKGKGSDSAYSSVYTVRIDKTAPQIVDLTNKDGKLQFKTADNLSGTAQVIVRENNTNYTLSKGTDGMYTFHSAVSGEHQVEIRVQDAAGNNVLQTVTVNKTTPIENKAPVITILEKPDETAWHNKEQQIRFTATDDSGKVTVQVDGGVSLQHKDGTNEYSFTVSEEGSKKYTITAKDDSGKETTQAVTVQIDSIAPALGDISVKEGSNGNKTVTVSVAENGSGIDKVKAVPIGNQGNSIEAVKEGNGYVLQLPSNASYMITATDKAGNESPAQQITLQDTPTAPPTPPTASSVTITGVEVENKDSVSESKAVIFTVNAELKKGESLKVGVKDQNGHDITPASTMGMNNTYSFEVTQNGTYTVRANIVKEDGTEGAVASQAIEVKNIDTAAPQILVTENKNGTVLFTVTDRKEDGEPGVTCDGDIVLLPVKETDKGEWKEYSYRLENLMSDEIVLKAVDKAGNQTTQKVAVAKAQQPTLTAENTILHSTDKKTAQTALTADPKGNKVKEVRVNRSGATVQKTAENRYQFTATENGEYLVELLTEQGLSASVKITVSGIEKQTAAPTIQPGEQKLNEAKTQVEIPISVSDTDSNLREVTLTSDHGELRGADGSYLLKATENGNYLLTARDAQGNESRVSIGVEQIKSDIAPSVRWKESKPDGEKTVVTLEVQDNGGAPITGVTDQNGTAAVSQGNGIYLLTVAESGTYTVTAKNLAGKTASVTGTVEQADVVAPEISELQVSYNANRSEATVSVTVTDSGAVSSVTLAGNGMTASGTTYQATVTENGSYTVQAVDAAGNSSVKTVTVDGIDKTAPAIQLTGKYDSWKKSHTVTFAVTDENSGVASVSVTKNGAPVSLRSENGYSFDVTENGVYTILASDLVGNASSKEVNITTIDKTAPAAPSLKNGEKAVSVYNAQTQKGAYNAKPDTTFTVSYQKAAQGESAVSVQVKVDKEQTFRTLSGDTPKLTLTEGTHTVLLKTVDAAGNESAAVTYRITVEKKQPETMPIPQTEPQGEEQQPVDEAVPQTIPELL